tara:strand:+ start:1497 stop:2522 length:1026 start_codon:yes stop_codon:yes gene_type:complete
MKKIITLLIIIPYLIISQQVTTETMLHNGLERSYILYVPESYSENNPTPLVLNLHGYSSNAGQQMIYSDFYTIAETEGFILIHPEGTVDIFDFQFWNSGDLAEIDDVGFLSALIDTIVSEYTINTDRVYSMGMSNGGFMSYRIACELSDKIAAIASVTGSMSTNQISSCNPSNPVPVMQVHGTSDPTVLYNGSVGIEPIDDVVSFWVNLNNCNTQPIFNYIADLNLIDLCTAEHYIYEEGDNDTSVELYKVINGGHTWPGAAIPLVGNNTNQDFSASEKIWEFFNKYDINGLISNNSQITHFETEKTIIKTIDILGRLCERGGAHINIYNDGSVEKKYLLK